MFCLLLIGIIASIAAYSSMIKPILDDAVASGTNNAFTDDVRLSSIVMSIGAGIVGILTIIVLLVPDFRNRFRTVLTKFVNEA